MHVACKFAKRDDLLITKGLTFLVRSPIRESSALCRSARAFCSSAELTRHFAALCRRLKPAPNLNRDSHRGLRPRLTRMPPLRAQETAGSDVGKQIPSPPGRLAMTNGQPYFLVLATLMFQIPSQY